MSLKITADGVVSEADDISDIPIDTRVLVIEEATWCDEYGNTIKNVSLRNFPCMPQLEELYVKLYDSDGWAFHFTHADRFFEIFPALRKVTASLEGKWLVIPPNSITHAELDFDFWACDISELKAERLGGGSGWRTHNMASCSTYLRTRCQPVELMIDTWVAECCGDVCVFGLDDHQSQHPIVLCPCEGRSRSLAAYEAEHGVSVWDALSIDYPLPPRAKSGH